MKFVQSAFFTCPQNRGYHQQQKFEYGIPFPVRLISQYGGAGDPTRRRIVTIVQSGPSNLGVNFAAAMTKATDGSQSCGTQRIGQLSLPEPDS